MTVDWTPLQQIIDANQRFAISSHVRPDADSIGSAIGMASLLEHCGKQVRIINPSPAPPNLRFLDPAGRIEDYSQPGASERLLDTDVHVIVDTSAWGQLADLAGPLRDSPAQKVVIDHHASSDDLGALEFKDVAADATGTLIFQLTQAVGAPIDAPVASALYAAIATDTGWFRFPSTTGETMRIAGRLIDLGARPDLIYGLLYEQTSLARMHLAGRVLSRMALECEGRLAQTFVRLADYGETKSKPSDTEDLVNECLRIGGTIAAYIAVELSNRRVKFSFRSRSAEINVAAVAGQFGGGGHKLAAGATLPGPFDEAREKVLAAMQTAIANLPRQPPDVVPPP